MVFIWQKLFGKTLKDLKLLKNLDLDNGVHLTETLTQISLHCKNFESLSIRRYTIRGKRRHQPLSIIFQGSSVWL